MLQSMQFTQLIPKKKYNIMLYNWEVINLWLLSDWSEIIPHGISGSSQMKSVLFGNFNMCSKVDFKMVKNSVNRGIKQCLLSVR